MVAAAIIGGSVASAAIGANASGKAASQQGQSAQFANNFSLGTYEQSQRDQRPYIDVGHTAESDILNGLHDGSLGGTFNSPNGNTFTPDQFLQNQDPGYGFQLNQGQQALQNSQAAQSGVLSGAALKGLIGYNQGMASTGYQNAYNRWLSTNQNAYSQWQGQQSNRYGMLANLSSLGENAAVGAGNSGVGYANGMANTAQAIGNAQAAGTVGTANAINSGISNGSGYMYLNSLMNGGGNSSYDTGFNGQNNPANQAGLDNLMNTVGA